MFWEHVSPLLNIFQISYTNVSSSKYLKMILAANFGNIISVLVASSWFPFDAISPSQMILQNLLYDFSMAAIPFDDMDDEYLQESHELSIWDLARYVLVVGPVTSTIDIGTFLLNQYFYGFGPAAKDLAIQKFQTHWFLQGLLSQALVVYVIRTAKMPFFQGRAPSSKLVMCTVFFSTIGIAIPYIKPLAQYLKLVKPENSFLGFLVAFLVRASFLSSHQQLSSDLTFYRYCMACSYN